VFASLVLMLLAAVSAPLLALIPMPAIAALLLLISWSLFDVAGWRQLWRFSRQDFAVAAATFAATISIRLEVAILLGTILSLVTFLIARRSRRSASWASTARAGAAVRRPQRRSRAAARVPAGEDDPHGRRGLLRRGLARQRPAARPARAGELAKHLLVMSKSMNFIDLAAADMWRAEMITRRSAGGDLYFHRPRAPVLELWQRIGFLAELGATTSSRPSGSRSRRSSSGSTAASAPTARSACSRSARDCRCRSTARRARHRRVRARAAARREPNAASSSRLRVTSDPAKGLNRGARTATEGDPHGQRSEATPTVELERAAHRRRDRARGDGDHGRHFARSSDARRRRIRD
jgi:hypothetical protein